MLLVSTYFQSMIQVAGVAGHQTIEGEEDAAVFTRRKVLELSSKAVWPLQLLLLEAAICGSHVCGKLCMWALSVGPLSLITTPVSLLDLVSNCTHTTDHFLLCWLCQVGSCITKIRQALQIFLSAMGGCRALQCHDRALDFCSDQCSTAYYWLYLLDLLNRRRPGRCLQLTSYKLRGL